MAVTEITKILFRRGRESDRRQLESFGGLAQGEPGFTSAEGWNASFGTAPTRYYVDDQNNVRASFLQQSDVVTWGADGGGDFFIGGTGGPDIYIGGTSAEKHWQRYFVSLRGTRCNTVWENTGGDESTVGYVDGTFQIGEAGAALDATRNDLDDEWDVIFYGQTRTDTGSFTNATGDTVPAWESQHRVSWDASAGKLSVLGGGALTIPSGPLGSRPAGTGGTAPEQGNDEYGDAVTGDIRFNTEWQTFEGYFDDTIGWGSLGGAIARDRQTYITVDTMGGQDGVATSQGEWEPAFRNLPMDNAINMVIDNDPVINSTSTTWNFLSGTSVNIDNSNLTTSNSTFNLINTNAGTVNAFGVAQNISMGRTGTGTLAINLNSGSSSSSSGALTVAGGVGVAGAIYTGGVVSIGSSSASTSTTTGALRVAGGAGIGLDLHVGQDIVAFSTSDEKFKNNVKCIESPLSKLARIDGVEFVWNEHAPASKTKGSNDIGVLAQQVQQVIPSAVKTRDDGTLAVDYTRVIPLLIESIKELTSRVESLENKQ